MNQKDRTYETNTAKNGLKMTIINYRKSMDIDVMFEDGTIITNKQYKYFKNGTIKHPHIDMKGKGRIGETNIAYNGMKMTIIEYKGTNNIDVQFEDGTVVTNRSYSCFKNGKIANPNIKRDTLIDRTGETSIATNGMQMTIINYRNASDIDIQFEDGTIVTHKHYSEFVKGYIAHKYHKARLIVDKTGETNIANNGMKMTIINYRGANDLDVQFEDGTVVTNKAYNSFIKGMIAYPTDKYYIGRTSVANNGLKMTVIAYRSCNDLDVQFEDGVVITNKTYNNFLKGKIAHPKIKVRKITESGIQLRTIDRTGKTNIASNGMKMTIIGYRGSEDIDIQFEDGTIVKNRSYYHFSVGCIKNPKYNKCRHVGTYNNEKLFMCTCSKCKNKHVLKLSEMKDFECKNI